METFEHPFYDIEIESDSGDAAAHLVKILSIDGRRFTYKVHAPLDENTINYIKSVIDAAVFGDMIIEHGPEGFEIRESRSRLKKHS
jgi:hypothetical protein